MPTIPAASLPSDAKERKLIPVFSGFIAYFPLAVAAVAELSRIGNEQHNPGQPLHWDRSKSRDELDAQMRHLLDVAISGDTAQDDDGVLHLTKNAWRAMAKLQKALEDSGATDSARPVAGRWDEVDRRKPVGPVLRYRDHRELWNEVERRHAEMARAARDAS